MANTYYAGSKIPPGTRDPLATHDPVTECSFKERELERKEGEKEGLLILFILSFSQTFSPSVKISVNLFEWTVETILTNRKKNKRCEICFAFLLSFILFFLSFST